MCNNILESLNNSLNEILQNYLSICSKFAMKKKYIDNDEILNNEITYLQISMNDLVIQLQNINFKIDNFKIDCLDDDTLQNDVNNTNTLTSNTSNSTPNSNIDLKTNKLLDKTINDLLPLFMLGLMNNDKDSILNNNTFMNSIKETIYSMSNQISNTTPAQNIQNTQHTQNTQYIQNINNYTSCIDDLD